MVMMTPASHQFVDQKLQEAAEGIEKAQREAAAKKAYKNFEMAIRVIYECRTEIDQETENDAVIGHLTTAVVALEAFDAGDTAPSIKLAMQAIKAMSTNRRIERKAPRSGGLFKLTREAVTRLSLFVST
ncbi:MAG: hypothetical protein ACLPV8_01085 [Steroidobacteraceae bacterium]